VDVVRTEVAELARPATRARQTTCVPKPYELTANKAPVAGSLRVQQPYGDKDERQETVNKVGMNGDPTSNSQ